VRRLQFSALVLALASQATVGNKFKAVMVAFILFVSGLYADDDKAHMERNKIFKKSASELTTEAPKTVRAVQQSSVVKTEGEYGIGHFFIELLTLATQKNPQLTAEMIKVGQEYLKEDGAKPDDLFKAPETNSVSNHSPSK